MALKCTLLEAPFRQSPEEWARILKLDAPEPVRNVSMLLQKSPRGTVRVVMHDTGFVRLEASDGTVTTFFGKPPLGCILRLCTPASESVTDGGET